MSPISLKDIASSMIKTTYGNFRMDVFHVGGQEAVVLHTENIPGENENVLCRIQSECLSHAFFDKQCDCAQQIASSLKLIAAKGGLLIYLRQEGMGHGLIGKLNRDARDWRNYHIAVEILTHYGIQSVRLVSTNKRKLIDLEAGSIKVNDYFWHQGKTILLGTQIERTVEQIRCHESERPVRQGEHPKVLVLGDLNMDDIEEHRGGIVNHEYRVGGTGYNAAVGLKAVNRFTPIIFGKIGMKDKNEEGLKIRKQIQEEDIYCLLGEHPEKMTGFVRITPTGYQGHKQYVWEKENNANDYDANNFRQAIHIAGLGKEDYIFIASYLFVQKQFNPVQIQEIFSIAFETGASLVLDLVRKSFEDDVLDECKVEKLDQECLENFWAGTRLYVVVGEMTTFQSFKLCTNRLVPNVNDLKDLFNWCKARWIVCRYDQVPDRRQILAFQDGGQVHIISDDIINTKEVNYGDKMFARALVAIEDHVSKNPWLRSLP